jgi:hypothetical protein
LTEIRLAAQIVRPVLLEMRPGVCDSVSLVWGQHMESLTKAVIGPAHCTPSLRLQIGCESDRISDHCRPDHSSNSHWQKKIFSYFISAVLNPIFCP